MKNLIFLLFSVLGFSGTAQNIFNPGYIITAEGDTIRGLIFEMSDAEMSRRIIFKKFDSAEIQKLSTLKITGFGFDSGREFERRTLLPNPGNDEDTTFIFAKNVLRGDIDVYSGRHFQKKKLHFFLDNNSKNDSIQIFRSIDAEALNMEEFLRIFINEPGSLKDPLGVRLREKRLLKLIASHNETMADRFPVEKHRENIDYDWNFLAGLPIDYRKDATHFRAGIFVSRTNIERTPNFSALFGIIYHHWERKETLVPEGITDGEINKKWQMLNVMPIAVKIQGNKGIFRPYGYIGVGAALLRETNVAIDFNSVAEEQQRNKFFPTINSGVGVKTRIGKHYIITELTPTRNNLFLNIGMSI